jgi:6-pyruvoyl tetrahydropterin synthase/QueD family protein
VRVLTVTRQFELSYAHHLPDYYGKCKEQHGHNALVEVTIAGALAEAGEADIRRTREGGTVGMLMDFADLKRIFDEEVMRYIDHRDVNETLGRGYYWNGVELAARWIGVDGEEVPGLEEVVGCVETTAEVIASWIYARLQRRMRRERKRLGIVLDMDLMLASVRFSETRDCWVSVG